MAGLTLPSGWRAESAEVFYSDDPVVVAGAADIAFLKAAASANPRLRARLCLHPAPDAELHEMVIVHHRDVYVRPHLHKRTAESFLVLEGCAVGVFFDPGGAVVGAEAFGAPGSGRSVLYRVPAGTPHMLLIESEWLVFVEGALGPFDRSQLVPMPWSPDESDPAAVTSFVRQTADRTRPFLAVPQD